MEFADGSGTKVNVGEGNKLFSYKLKLPEGVTCDQCVIQVRLSLNHYLTIYIIRVTLNTEFDTVSLFGWHAQRTHFRAYPLVCTNSIWPGQGFYVEHFLIDAFPPEWQSKWKRAFS